MAVGSTPSSADRAVAATSSQAPVAVPLRVAVVAAVAVAGDRMKVREAAVCRRLLDPRICPHPRLTILCSIAAASRVIPGLAVQVAVAQHLAMAGG